MLNIFIVMQLMHKEECIMKKVRHHGSAFPDTCGGSANDGMAGLGGNGDHDMSRTSAKQTGAASDETTKATNFKFSLQYRDGDKNKQYC